MPVERKNACKKTAARNRRIQYQARKKVEDRLTKQYGGTKSARQRARAFMKGKHVHHSGRGLELVDSRKHGKKHGRGHKGKPRLYRRA